MLAEQTLKTLLCQMSRVGLKGFELDMKRNT